MHPTQLNILDSLRQGDTRKFNELLRDIAETSDNLTYHLKQLQKGGFITSPTKGEYALSNKGTVHLNNNLELNHDLFPTVSCMLELHGKDDTVLAMRKLKQPYLGSIHLPTFGVISTQSLQSQIDDFLDRYHIIASSVAFQRVHRKREKDTEELVIFDKFFMVFRGNFTSFEKAIHDREFIAVTVPELRKHPQLLPTSEAMLPGTSVGFTESIENSPF